MSLWVWAVSESRSEIMSENIRDKNFLLIKLTLLIVFSVYGIMNEVNETGVSVKILLLVSLYIGCLTAKNSRREAGRRYVLPFLAS